MVGRSQGGASYVSPFSSSYRTTHRRQTGNLIVDLLQAFSKLRSPFLLASHILWTLLKYSVFKMWFTYSIRHYIFFYPLKLLINEITHHRVQHDFFLLLLLYRNIFFFKCSVFSLKIIMNSGWTDLETNLHRMIFLGVQLVFSKQFDILENPFKNCS